MPFQREKTLSNESSYAVIIRLRCSSLAISGRDENALMSDFPKLSAGELWWAVGMLSGPADLQQATPGAHFALLQHFRTVLLNRNFRLMLQLQLCQRSRLLS